MSYRLFENKISMYLSFPLWSPNKHYTERLNQDREGRKSIEIHIICTIAISRVWKDHKYWVK